MADLKTLGKYYLLSSLPVLHSLSDSEKSYIAEKAVIKDIKRHEFLYQQGSPCDYFYIIVNGSIELQNTIKIGEEEKQVSVEVMRKGDFLGIVSLMGNKPHTFSAIALGDVRLFLISAEDFNDIITKIPSLGVVISRVLTRQIRI